MANPSPTVAVDFLKGGTGPGPVGTTRMQADSSGSMQVSVDGAPFVPVVGGGTLPSTAILADATTNTAPDGIIERHTTSGTAAAGFGLTDAVELQSAAGNVRRVMTDGTSLVVATDGAEEARRDITLFVAGASQKAASFGWLSGNPVIYVGDPALGVGILRAGGFFQLLSGNTAVFSANATVGTIFVPITVVGKVLSSDSLKQGAALTNADLSVSVVGGAEYTLPAATLSASHILTLAVTGSPITNQILRVTRLDVTANTYVVKDDAATTLLTFPVSLKGTADFKFNGTHFVLDRYAVLN